MNQEPVASDSGVAMVMDVAQVIQLTMEYDPARAARALLDLFGETLRCCA